MNLLKSKYIYGIFCLFWLSHSFAQDSDLHIQKAFFHYQQKDYNNALLYLDSTSVQNAHRFSLQGKCRMHQALFNVAIKDLKKANHFQAHCSDYHLALCYAQTNHYDSTYYYLEQNLTSANYKQKGFSYKLDTLLQEFRKSEYWQKILKRYPFSESEKSLEQAIYYSQHKEVDLALDILDELIRKDKKNAEYYYYRALYILLFNQDYDYAIGDLKKAIKYDHSKTEYFEFLGDCYVQKERYKKAFSAYLSADKLFPYQLELKYKLAFSAFRMGQNKLAEKQIAQYLAVYNKNLEALKLMALIQYEEGKYQSAVDYLYEALSIESRRADLLIARGKAFMALENYQSALWDFGTATDLDNRSGEFWFYKGLAYLYMENTKEACKSFTRAQNLNYYQASEYLLKECQ